jgi:hypothetical protein
LRGRAELGTAHAGSWSRQAASGHFGMLPEFRRVRIIEKVGARNTADLIRIVMIRRSASDSPSLDSGSSI